ncbi:MAG: iron-sulfur cluster-binding domain-containing protein [Saprospiraceae bacterium]|nr:iron-sulfur cluster-binding domain-containing protein [Saprospiraceae bacterium]
MDQKRQFRIVGKVCETPDTATFMLQAADHAPFDYLPGQYLSIIFDTRSGEKRRAYSFSSCPGVDALPAITVRRVVNGEFSNFLLSHAKPGDLLSTTEAHGRFVLPSRLPGAIFYIAAGSGITPVMSHLKQLLFSKKKEMPRIVLYYANRDSRGTIFKSQLDTWIREFPQQFECTYFFSREKDAAHSLNRHLSNRLLEEMLVRHFEGKIGAEALNNTLFYLCAPKALMRMAEMTLRVLDFPDSAIYKETFTPDLQLPQRKLDMTHQHTVIAESRDERIEFRTYEGETILNAALRQGIALPYSCKSGICLSCLATCKEGLVDLDFAEATTRTGPGQTVNTCIGYAVSDRVVLHFE